VLIVLESATAARTRSPPTSRTPIALSGCGRTRGVVLRGRWPAAGRGL